MNRCLLLLLCALMGSASGLPARDVFVMLSGGVSPFDNNYSQYLQARAINACFEKNYPRDSVWTFFGAGNVEGERAVMADVCRKVTRDKLTIDTWLPGAIPHNLPASREVVLRVFREEILPAVAGGGTLFLFVGDHGSRAGRNGESEIDLWELTRDPRGSVGWRYETNAALGVTEFRRTLAAGIGKGRVVFCMTQCHAGGFHSLAIPAEMSPNPRWFSQPPDWLKAKPKAVPAFPRAAGFTATDEFSAASGCVADPDENNWAGYERFIPEHLFGVDLFTRETTRAGLRSFAEAHVAATLQDFTIDKPSSTSDEFLERWATLLDSRLAGERQLTARVRSAVAAYQRTLDGGWPKIADPAFRERQMQFGRFIESLSEQNPRSKTLLLTGTRKELELAIGPSRERRPIPPVSPGPQTNRPPRRPRSGASAENRRLWRETVRPAWTEVVESGEITNRLSFPLEFEKHLLKAEKEQNKFFLSGGQALEEEGFWFSGYGQPETVNPKKAEAVARWTLERRAKIIAWAAASDDEDVSDAAAKLSQRRARPRANAQISDEEANPSPSLSKKTAAERALFYRRVLGAWEFLLAVNERPALARLRELTELERTPLPPARP